MKGPPPITSLPKLAARSAPDASLLTGAAGAAPPAEAGQEFRREGGHLSAMKAARRYSASTSCCARRQPLFEPLDGELDLQPK
jgi:hypothetical protein